MIDEKTLDSPISIWFVRKILGWAFWLLAIFVPAMNAYSNIRNDIDYNKSEIVETKSDVKTLEKRVDDMQQVKADIQEIKANIEWIKKKIN